MAASPDNGLFGPTSVTWRVHAEPSMVIGGIRALLMQLLHPLVMAAVEEHSDYQQQPWRRLYNTVNYVLDTTYADTTTARAAAERVRATHKGIAGVDRASGRPYRAGDPALLLWVHAVEVDSFLVAFRQYAGRLSDDEADRYVAEMVTAAELVGLSREDIPRSYRSLAEYINGMNDLSATPASRRLLALVLAPPINGPLRVLRGLPGRAAIGLLPERFKTMYGVRSSPFSDQAVRLAAVAMSKSLGLLLPRDPEKRARRRLELVLRLGGARDSL